jgi:hypothetical protein
VVYVKDQETVDVADYLDCPPLCAEDVGVLKFIGGTVFSNI